MIVLLCERAKCDAKRRTALASKHAPTRAGAQLCVLRALTWTGDTLARTYELLIASTGGERRNRRNHSFDTTPSARIDRSRKNALRPRGLIVNTLTWRRFRVGA